jgi:serine/threonine protein kinase
MPDQRPVIDQRNPFPRMRFEGQRVGNYVLHSRLDLNSNNAFGEVWRAHRVRPHQLVAIKFMRPDTVRPDLVHRFARKESTSLAMMRHPYIASFHDFQFDGDDPYLVMEFVPDAMPITTYCDRKRLGFAQRMELCAKACEAVAEVHHAGIIHRDLKPQNILVTEVGGVPVPKLIDFGLARRERAESPLDPNHISVGNFFMGTYLYASPEQLQELPVERIQRASDVYAIGSVLFELLVGTTPMAHVLLDQAMTKEQRDELLAHASRPSLEQALAIIGPERITAVAEARGVPVAALRAFARSRARHVVATALRVEPAARFPSAGAMADDLRACIDGLDFRHAAQEPWRNRFARSVRRNRLAWTAGAVVAGTLTATAVVTTVLWVRAEAERHRAERTFSFFDGRFLRASQAEADDPSTPMADHVRRAVDALSTDLGGDPETAARASVTLARTALSLGDHTLAREALDAGRGVVARSVPGSLAGFDAEAASVRADIDRLAGNIIDCDATERSLGELLQHGSTPSLFAARALAGSLKDRNCLDAAERAYRMIQERGERAWSDDLDRLIDRHNLCLTRELRAKGSAWTPASALAVLPARAELTEDCRRQLGPRHWQTLASDAERIRLVWKSGDREAAIEAYRALTAELTAPGHHIGWRAADAIANMAFALDEEGDGNGIEAIGLLEVALATNRSQRPLHRTTHAVAERLAQVLERQGAIERARAVLLRSCRDAAGARPSADREEMQTRAQVLADFCRRHPVPHGAGPGRTGDPCACPGP